MKTFVWTFIVVAVGIYIYNRWTQASTVNGVLTLGPISIKTAESSTYYGPDVDPQTGSYLTPGAQPGTVSPPTAPIA